MLFVVISCQSVRIVLLGGKLGKKINRFGVEGWKNHPIARGSPDRFQKICACACTIPAEYWGGWLPRICLRQSCAIFRRNWNFLSSGSWFDPRPQRLMIFHLLDTILGRMGARFYPVLDWSLALSCRSPKELPIHDREQQKFYQILPRQHFRGFNEIEGQINLSKLGRKRNFAKSTRVYTPPHPTPQKHYIY